MDCDLISQSEQLLQRVFCDKLTESDKCILQNWLTGKLAVERSGWRKKQQEVLQMVETERSSNVELNTLIRWFLSRMVSLLKRFSHVASRRSEIETRRLPETDSEREGGPTDYNYEKYENGGKSGDEDDLGTKKRTNEIELTDGNSTEDGEESDENNNVDLKVQRLQKIKDTWKSLTRLFFVLNRRNETLLKTGIFPDTGFSEFNHCKSRKISASDDHKQQHSKSPMNNLSNFSVERMHENSSIQLSRLFDEIEHLKQENAILKRILSAESFSPYRRKREISNGHYDTFQTEPTIENNILNNNNSDKDKNDRFDTNGTLKNSFKNYCYCSMNQRRGSMSKSDKSKDYSDYIQKHAVAESTNSNSLRRASLFPYTMLDENKFSPSKIKMAEKKYDKLMTGKVISKEISVPITVAGALTVKQKRNRLKNFKHKSLDVTLNVDTKSNKLILNSTEKMTSRRSSVNSLPEIPITDDSTQTQTLADNITPDEINFSSKNQVNISTTFQENISTATQVNNLLTNPTNCLLLSPLNNLIVHTENNKSIQITKDNIVNGCGYNFIHRSENNYEEEFMENSKIHECIENKSAESSHIIDLLDKDMHFLSVSQYQPRYDNNIYYVNKKINNQFLVSNTKFYNSSTNHFPSYLKVIDKSSKIMHLSQHQNPSSIITSNMKLSPNQTKKNQLHPCVKNNKISPNSSRQYSNKKYIHNSDSDRDQYNKNNEVIRMAHMGQLSVKKMTSIEKEKCSKVTINISRPTPEPLFRETKEYNFLENKFITTATNLILNQEKEITKQNFSTIASEINCNSNNYDKNKRLSLLKNETKCPSSTNDQLLNQLVIHNSHNQQSQESLSINSSFVRNRFSISRRGVEGESQLSSMDDSSSLKPSRSQAENTNQVSSSTDNKQFINFPPLECVLNYSNENNISKYSNAIVSNLLTVCLPSSPYPNSVPLSRKNVDRRKSMSNSPSYRLLPAPQLVISINDCNINSGHNIESDISLNIEDYGDNRRYTNYRNVDTVNNNNKDNIDASFITENKNKPKKTLEVPKSDSVAKREKFLISSSAIVIGKNKQTIKQRAKKKKS